jgi:hypothetical protein
VLDESRLNDAETAALAPLLDYLATADRGRVTVILRYVRELLKARL